MYDERGSSKHGSCGSVEGGYTIFLEEDRIRTFMEAGDFSSASELDHFTEVGSRIERHVREEGGASFLALSIGEKTLSRNFSALQIAHLLAKHGKKVLLVDCDFLHPGLSGIVDNLEEHGFLDLLLYGSSLKTVTKTIGVDGVSIAGPGSFPVSRTIPFALKEFGKIRDFLRAKHDVVIYCSSLHTEDGRVNPLASLVDGIVVSCRIEDLGEGELEKHLAALGAERIPPVELVCFCGKREEARAEAHARPAAEKEPAIPRIVPPAGVSGEEERAAEALLEKMDEVEPLEKRRRRRIDVPKIVGIAAAAVIVAFVVWWVAVHRTMQEPESRGPSPVETRTAPADTGLAAAGEPGAPTVSAPRAERDTAALGAAPGAMERKREGAAPGAAGPPKYTIHIASFTETARAEAEKKYLEGNGYEARIVEVPLRGEMWLRVFAGSYASREEAEEARLALLGLKRIGYARIVAIDRLDK